MEQGRERNDSEIEYFRRCVHMLAYAVKRRKTLAYRVFVQHFSSRMQVKTFTSDLEEGSAMWPAKWSVMFRVREGRTIRRRQRYDGYDNDVGWTSEGDYCERRRQRWLRRRAPAPSATKAHVAGLGNRGGDDRGGKKPRLGECGAFSFEFFFQIGGAPEIPPEKLP